MNQKSIMATTKSIKIYQMLPHLPEKTQLFKASITKPNAPNIQTHLSFLPKLQFSCCKKTI